MTNMSCSLFFYEGYDAVAPTIINIVCSLKSLGYSVTIYTIENQYPKLEKIGNKVTVIYFRKAADLPLGKTIFKILCRIKLGTLVPVIELGIYTLQVFTYIFRNYQVEICQNNIRVAPKM